MTFPFMERKFALILERSNYYELQDHANQGD